MAVFPLTNLLDDFNRADNASLGADWTEAVNGKTNRAAISGNRVTVTGSGASSIAAWTKAGGPAGGWIACQYTMTAITASVTDSAGLGVTLVSDTTKGFHTELDLTTTDLVTAFLNDSTLATVATVTATGFGQLVAGDKLGFIAQDNGSTVSMEQWIGRGAVWTQIATAVASGAQYLAGTYYPNLRVKYDTEFIDDFYASLVTAAAIPQNIPALSGLGW